MRRDASPPLKSVQLHRGGKKKPTEERRKKSTEKEKRGKGSAGKEETDGYAPKFSSAF